MMQRYRIAVAAVMALLLYSLCVLLEAAYFAAELGFNELLTAGKIISGLSEVRTHDLVKVLCRDETNLGGISIIGMLAAVSFVICSKHRIPTWVIAVYTLILVLSGSWMGYFVFAYLPFETLDGEFLAEGMPRYAASSFWTTILAAILVMRWCSNNTGSEQIDGQISSESKLSDELSS